MSFWKYKWLVFFFRKSGLFRKTRLGNRVSCQVYLLDFPSLLSFYNYVFSEPTNWFSSSSWKLRNFDWRKSRRFFLEYLETFFLAIIESSICVMFPGQDCILSLLSALKLELRRKYERKQNVWEKKKINDQITPLTPSSRFFIPFVAFSFFENNIFFDLTAFFLHPYFPPFKLKN